MLKFLILKYYTILKLKLSSLFSNRLKFCKICIENAVDQNIVIKLHKSGKSNVEIAKRLEMNCSTVWKIVKKFKKTSNTIDRKGKEENEVSTPLNS